MYIKVLELIEGIHSCVTGTGECSPEQLKEALDTLQQKIKDWRPSTLSTLKPVEDEILSLACLTLREGKACLFRETKVPQNHQGVSVIRSGDRYSVRHAEVVAYDPSTLIATLVFFDNAQPGWSFLSSTSFSGYSDLSHPAPGHLVRVTCDTRNGELHPLLAVVNGICEKCR